MQKNKISHPNSRAVAPWITSRASCRTPGHVEGKLSHPGSRRGQAVARIFILMGVSGAGKSTVGRLLAERLRWPFIEGDDYHLPESKVKMNQGVPLGDADRQPWLDVLNGILRGAPDGRAVLACSALKDTYRQRLTRDLEGVHFIYLHGTVEQIQNRLAGRSHAYWNNDLLPSQFEALEPPANTFTLSINHPPETQVDQIVEHFRPTTE